MHSLRSVLKCLPGVSADRGARVRHYLSGTDRKRFDSAFARAGVRPFIVCIVVVRKVHECLSGESGSASSSDAEPQEYGGDSSKITFREDSVSWLAVDDDG